jgi:hypothetical protein
MKEKGLIKQFSVERLLMELDKIKLFKLSDGEMIVSEISKKIKRF